MLLFGEEQSIKKDEDVETIVIRSEFRLFGAHTIDRDGYIPSNEQVSVYVHHQIHTSFLHLSSHCLLHLRHYQPLLPIFLYFLFLSL